MCKRMTLLVMCAAVCALLFTGLAETYTLTAPSKIKEIESSLKPGDVVVFPAGTWKDVQIAIDAKGTQEMPVTIRAAEPGKTVFSGNSFLRLNGAFIYVDGVVYRDLILDSGAVVSFGKESDSCRLTNSAIINFQPEEDKGRIRAIVLGGNNHSVEYCYIERGPVVSFAADIVIVNDEAKNYYHIFRNYFAGRPPVGGNGGETIQIGSSRSSRHQAGCVVESNYFENCNGEAEIITVKSGENIIRYNTFKTCKGAVTLRQCWGTFVEGNFFLGNHVEDTGGVRAVGADQRIINNLFHQLAGTSYASGVSIMNGEEWDAPASYPRFENGLIAFNTFIDCKMSFMLGLYFSKKLPLPPKDSKIVNNIVFSNQAPLVTFYDNCKPENIEWSGNIFYGAKTGLEGKVEALKNNIAQEPKLLNGNNFWRIDEKSPARDAAVGTFPDIYEDIEGQRRIAPKDIGCDEYSDDEALRGILSPAEVGPFWMRESEKIAEPL